MNRFITLLLTITLLFNLIQALPVFDAELAASPLMHEVRINYRGGRKSVYTGQGGNEDAAALLIKKKK